MPIHACWCLWVPSLVLFLLYVSGEDVTLISGPSITGEFPVCLGSSCLSSPGMLLIQVSHRHPTQPTPNGAHRCPSTTDFWSAAWLGLLSLLLGCPSRGFRAPPWFLSFSDFLESCHLYFAFSTCCCHHHSHPPSPPPHHSGIPSIG